MSPKATNALKPPNVNWKPSACERPNFITIASHELRTPLAQIRGHTDIIEALNEQGILDQRST